MKITIFVLMGLLFFNVNAKAQTLDWIGRSDKAAILAVSPDGKWLLSWDGVTENTPATNPGDRLVWNLATKTARDISKWSKSEEIYDIPCGWTPDSGRLLRTLKAPKNASYPGLLGKDLFLYMSDDILVYGRLSDGKTLWQRTYDKYRGQGKPMTKLWVLNNINGRDRRVLYGATFDGEIYRCAAREMEP